MCVFGGDGGGGEVIHLIHTFEWRGGRTLAGMQQEKGGGGGGSDGVLGMEGRGLP